MTQRLPGTTSRGPRPPRMPARSTSALYDLVETRVRRVLVDNPLLATSLGIHTEDDRLGDASRDAVLGGDRRRPATPGRDRGARPGRPLGRGARRARPGDPQPPARRCSRRTRCAAGSAARPRPARLGDGVFLLFARDARPSRRAPGSPSRRGWRACRRSWRRRRHGRQGRRSRSGSRWRRGMRETCRRCSPRSAARPTDALDERALARLDRAIDGANARPRGIRGRGWRRPSRRQQTTGPLGPRALRRARPVAGIRGPGRRRDPRARLRPAARQPGGAAHRGPGDRSGRGRAERRRADQERSSRDVRGGARGLSRRDAPGPGHLVERDLVTIPAGEGSR